MGRWPSLVENRPIPKYLPTFSVSVSLAGTISGVPQNVVLASDGSMAFVSVMNANAAVIDTAIDKVIEQLPATNTLGVAISQ